MKYTLKCPDCNGDIETVVTDNGNSHKTKHYCTNSKCPVIEVKYKYTTNEYGEKFISVKSVKREARARPQPLKGYTWKEVLDNRRLNNYE